MIRLRQMAVEGALKYPIVAINDTPTKHLFDNRFGTGQSALDGIIRATNVLLAGKNFVVSGFGDCGRGVASRAQGLGANVIVTEVDEIRALEAVMDGYRVMPMSEAVKVGDIFCTVTGDRDIIRTEHIEAMKDGAIISNAGHFDIEIDVAGLRKMASSERIVRRNVEEFILNDGRRVRLLAEGRLVNLGAAEGHPAAVMDMSFAGQALTLHHLTQLHKGGHAARPGRPQRARGARLGDREREAQDDGRRDRHAHAGAEVVPRELARGHLTRPGTFGSGSSSSASRGLRSCADSSMRPKKNKQDASTRSATYSAPLTTSRGPSG